jgi:hypothetical protein
MILGHSLVVSVVVSVVVSIIGLPSPAAAQPAAAREASQARMTTDLPKRGEGEARRTRASVAPLEQHKPGKLEKQEDQVAGGTHWRIKTDVGSVHVWVPAGYDRETAGTVVYVHGYYTDSDGAWRDHQLAKQFRASKQNALFIVPDAPSGNGEDVKWHALTDLRKAVSRANIRIPDGPTVVMGHSGAFRTVMKWVDHKVVAQVILLDALYGGAKSFDDFIGSGKRAKHHKLIMIGSDTAEESRGFIKRYPFAVARDSMPGNVDGFTRREKKAKLLYVRSQFEHMAIVKSGKVIPLLLRLTPLTAVGVGGEDNDEDGAEVKDGVTSAKKRAAKKPLWPFSSVLLPPDAADAPTP